MLKEKYQSYYTGIFILLISCVSFYKYSNFAMKLLLIASVLLFSSAASSQDFCSTSYFDTTDVFSESQIISEVRTYGKNRDWKGNMVDLDLQIFRPAVTAAFAKLPMIIMIHGGGFVGGTYNGMQRDASYLAKKGFICVSIDYRLGWDNENPLKGYTVIPAYYRAAQDARAAIRYMVKNADTYNVDTSSIFVFGRSAGAVTALFTAFYSQEEFDRLLRGVSDSLGGINNATNSIVADYTIKGVSSVAGAVLDTSVINADDAMPVIMYHSTGDEVIPFGAGHGYNNPQTPEMHGSSVIKDRLEELNEAYELCYQEGGSHGSIYEDNPAFMYQQLSHFFKRIFCKNKKQIIYNNITLLQDEQINCLSAYPGKIASAQTFFCGADSVILTSTAYTQGYGSSFQWQYSYDRSEWVNASNASNPAYAKIGNLDSTTYFRLKGTCNTLRDYSNVLTIKKYAAYAAQLNFYDTLICKGQKIRINDDNPKSKEWLWQPVNTIYRGVNVSPNVTTVYTLISKNTEGCISQKQCAVKVFGNVDAGTETAACYSGNAKLNGTSDIPENKVAWSTLGDGFFDDTLKLTAIYTPGVKDIADQNAKVVLKATDSRGQCSSTSSSATVKMNPQLFAKLNADPIICKGGTTTLTVNGQGGTAPYNGVGAFEKPQGTYSYTITDAAGCSATDRIVLTPGTKDLPAKPGFISGQSYNLCGIVPLLSYSVPFAADANTYKWTVPEGINIFSTDGSELKLRILSGFTTSGDLYVAARNECGTGEDRKMTLYAITPDPTEKMLGKSSVTERQKNVSYRVNDYDGFPYYNWTVPQGADITEGQGTSQIKVKFGTRSGDVSVTLSNLCGNSPAGKIYVSVASSSKYSVAANGSANPIAALSVFPNPASSLVSFSFNGGETPGKYKAAIYDMHGKVVTSFSGKTVKGNNTIQQNISILPVGIYMLTVTTSEKTERIKLVKAQ